jgi:hypothetical protein
MGSWRDMSSILVDLVHSTNGTARKYSSGVVMLAQTALTKIEKMRADYHKRGHHPPRMTQFGNYTRTGVAEGNALILVVSIILVILFCVIGKSCTVDLVKGVNNEMNARRHARRRGKYELIQNEVAA